MPKKLEDFAVFDLAVFAAPGVFVVLWASGFVGAKLGLAYAEPLTFLALRMAAAVALIGVVTLLTRPKWPGPPGVVHSVVTGLLIHGFYLGGVFVAIENGLSAGMIALVVSLQPVLTSTLANRWLGERVRALQWLGLALGVAGVYLIVRDKATTGGATPFAWLAGVVALSGITVGTLYQKRFGGGIDWRPGLCIQYGAALLMFTLGAFAFETRTVDVDAAISVRHRLVGSGAVVRRGVAALLSDPPRRGDARGQSVLSDAAGDGADGLGAVRRAPGAARARRHGGLRRRRVSGELEAERVTGKMRNRPVRPRESGDLSGFPLSRE